MKHISLKTLGIIYSEFIKVEGTPIQPTASKDSEGKIVIFDEFVEGLKDIEGFSHIILLYYFNQLIRKHSLTVKPFLDDEVHGVFATRAPNRPNPIGLSIVRLTAVDGNTLYVSDIDIINKTPLLDIKPYIPEFDHRDKCKTGWLNSNIDGLNDAKDDGRFI